MHKIELYHPIEDPQSCTLNFWFFFVLLTNPVDCLLVPCSFFHCKGNSYPSSALDSFKKAYLPHSRLCDEDDIVEKHALPVFFPQIIALTFVPMPGVDSDDPSQMDADHDDAKNSSVQGAIELRVTLLESTDVLFQAAAECFRTTPEQLLLFADRGTLLPRRKRLVDTSLVCGTRVFVARLPKPAAFLNAREAATRSNVLNITCHDFKSEISQLIMEYDATLTRADLRLRVARELKVETVALCLDGDMGPRRNRRKLAGPGAPGGPKPLCTFEQPKSRILTSSFARLQTNGFSLSSFGIEPGQTIHAFAPAGFQIFVSTFFTVVVPFFIQFVFFRLCVYVCSSRR